MFAHVRSDAVSFAAVSIILNDNVVLFYEEMSIF